MASLISGLASVVFGTVSAAAEQAKTWGHNIHWVSLNEGKKLVRESGKPAMIVFHKPWCRACKALRPRFANSRDIEKISADFIMIKVEEDDTNRNSDLSPDGAYVPRILFMDPNGNVLKNVQNKGADGYKYYYYETKSIVDSMKSVLKLTHNTRSYKK